MIQGQKAQRGQAHRKSIYYISFRQNMRCEMKFSLNKTLLLPCRRRLQYYTNLHSVIKCNREVLKFTQSKLTNRINWSSLFDEKQSHWSCDFSQVRKIVPVFPAFRSEVLRVNVFNAPAGKMKFFFCIQSIILIASLQNYNSKNIENNAEIMT